ncbi:MULTISPECIES: cyanophycin synthetase [unclassified Pusillimonas]|uniref:cyanophycin synthetase n=1 Tax=unclassified Pusillimonas TaxID=2640016 RepID=UPI000B9D29CF|nr:MULTISPECIES: cyanophycin synthetase [unclassified Pusillimonas]OXR50106.1 cyanophycin synthetase [Pusillimonas sp. T2]ROT46512.1 cyanophycin synthetase [Pusillimonas sp. NJUB218]
MEITRIRALRGPNLWGRQTSVEAVVACDSQEQDIEALDGFEVRIRARFPEIDLLKPAGQEQPLSMAHVLASAALRLQALAGCPVSFCRVAPTFEPGVYQVIVEYTEEEVGRQALDDARDLCNAALADKPFDLALVLARLREMDEDVRLGPSTGAIVQAAQRRGIPYHRLTQGSLVQFGWGRRQRRIQAAETDRTSAIAEAIAQDKALTKRLLASAGISVPEGRIVQDADQAWAAAQSVGLPVVVKPRDGNQGKGVAVNLQTQEAVLQAFHVAVDICNDVIVERYFPGHDFRLLVVGNQLVAAARRDPPQVIGDGVRSIAELVEAVNADPARGEGHGTSLTRIRLGDEIALSTMARQGYTPDSIPENGVLVTLRNNANLSTGGSATDVTDQVHPELAEVAVAAARMVGLDICGIDLVAQNVFEPLTQENGCIVEVNAAPGLRMHLAPSFGKPRPVGESIIDAMFAEGETGRVPVTAVAGTNGKTTTTRLIAHLLGVTGKCVGMTNSDGVYVGNQCIDTGDCSGPRSARHVLLHPYVDAAVFETARGGILREGLAFDRCDVAVVTNIGVGDHLGLNYITTVEDLAAVKRVVVENVAPTGTAVLNAADPIVAAMAATCPGQVIFFSTDPSHPVLATHRAQGQRVVFVEPGRIILAEGASEQSFALSGIPLTQNGRIGFQVENAMAAMAAAWALGLSFEDMQKGLASFVNDAQTAPGRFNMFSYNGATVIADYGHNPDAMLALVQAVDQLPATHRSVVISGAGDRRDEDITRQTEILGDAFDEVILYEDMCQRGRAEGEVVALLRQGLAGAKRAQKVDEIHGEFVAIDLALERLKAGDLCLILIDQVEEALAHIARRVAEAA